LGLASIEADVWLVTKDAQTDSAIDSDPILLVGHEDRDLKHARTLKTVYLDPIWEILERVNQGNDGSPGWKGVFTDRGVPDQTLILQIDTVSISQDSRGRFLITFSTQTTNRKTKWTAHIPNCDDCLRLS
jgi:hypothetical protein